MTTVDEDFNALLAERDELERERDYWKKQYVIESMNADDFHAERDELQRRLDLQRGVSTVSVDELRAERNELRATLERVEALRDEWRARGWEERQYLAVELTRALQGGSE